MNDAKKHEPADTLERMLAVASDARANAHAPYSNFKVGACLRGDSGRLFGGCNVENAAYPMGQCAEATALGALIAAGDKRVLECLVVAEGGRLTTPCGGCRQRLSEFAGPELKVHVCDPGGPRWSVTLGELLPHSFGRDHLDR